MSSDRAIIEATTSVVAVSKATSFGVILGNDSVRITAPGLGSGETVTVHFSNDNGATFTPVQQVIGITLQLTENLNTIKLQAPGTYGFSKTATASAVGVFITTGA